MSKTEFKIGNRAVGGKNPVFIIAEISGNHNQSFERAVEIIKAAHEVGADAIKLQTYTADTITIDSDKPPFMVGAGDRPENWKGQTLYQLYTKAYTPWEWQPKLKKIAEDLGMILFSTPFDDTAIDFLEKMDVPCYKVASFECTDTWLLKKIAKTKKPVIISRGMASEEELKEAVSTLRENGTDQIAVLHCVSAYPAKPEEMNLKTIPDIRERFGVVSGLSDHTLGIEVAIAAVALGASIIEKHVTLDRSAGGVDDSFSLEPHELKQLVSSVRVVEKALGKPHYVPASPREAEEKHWRRSLFVVQNIKKGEKFTSENVRSIRPADGLPTKFFDEIIGKTAKRDIERGTPLAFDLISENALE